MDVSLMLLQQVKEKKNLLDPGGIIIALFAVETNPSYLQNQLFYYINTEMCSITETLKVPLLSQSQE